MLEKINAMLSERSFAVVGASTNPEKYGYIAYVTLRKFGKTVYAINPRASEIAGDRCYPTILSLPEAPEVVVSVVPPKLTEGLIADLTEAGVKNLWIQPGAESAKAVADAEANGVACVHGGPCIMVCLTTRARRG